MTEKDHGRLLSAEDAHRVLGIPAGTVRSWYNRRNRTGLWDVGRDKRNHPLFYEADLLALKLRRQIRDKAGRRHHVMSDVVDSGTPDNELCEPRHGVSRSTRTRRNSS